MSKLLAAAKKQFISVFFFFNKSVSYKSNYQGFKMCGVYVFVISYKICSKYIAKMLKKV